MQRYRRVLAFVTVAVDAPAVVSRAAQLARLHASELALAAVVDIVPGFECDRYPVVTGDELRREIATDVRARLERLLADARGAGEILVACGEESEAVTHVLRSWRPDLVVVSRRADHGVTSHARAGHDVLAVGGDEHPGFAGRLMNALASML